MPSKATFTSVEIISMTRSPEAGTLEVKCPLTQSIIKAMGWVQKKEVDGHEVVISSEIPAFLRGAAKMDGELASTITQFIPNDEILQRKHTMDLNTTKVNGFTVYRLQAESTKAHGQFRHELRLTLHFNDENGARKIETFMQAVSKSKLVVSYEKQAVQDELPGTEVVSEAQQEEFADV